MWSAGETPALQKTTLQSAKSERHVQSGFKIIRGYGRRERLWEALFILLLFLVEWSNQFDI